MTDIEYLKMNYGYDRLEAVCIRDAIEEIEIARVVIPDLLSACRATLTVLDAVQNLIYGDDETNETLARLLTRGKLRSIIEASVARATGEATRRA